MMATRTLLVVLIALAFACAARPAVGDETDQFTLPDRERFTDMGPYVDLFHCRVLEQIVEEKNREIDRALRIRNDRRREAALARLHAPEPMAHRARQLLGQGFVAVRQLEGVLFSDDANRAYPDQLIAHKSDDWIYARTHLPLDPRTVVLNFRGPTVKVHGTYFGIDKFGHAFDLGHLYYTSYRRALSRGFTEEQAMQRTIRVFSRGPISERGIIGVFATGVISNADLASNYIGMKWYLNMTEATMVNGDIQPPMLVRVGNYWALNEHVRPDSGFMAPFYTDHLNEALNPCWYEWGMRDEISRRLRDNADDILAFYAHDDGQQRTRAEFTAMYEQLSTYFGEDYGHYGIDPEATIANTCFPNEQFEQQQAARAMWLDPAAMP